MTNRYKDKEGRRNDNFLNVIMSQELFNKILGSYAKKYDQYSANRDTNVFKKNYLCQFVGEGGWWRHMKLFGIEILRPDRSSAAWC